MFICRQVKYSRFINKGWFGIGENLLGEWKHLLGKCISNLLDQGQLNWKRKLSGPGYKYIIHCHRISISWDFYLNQSGKYVWVRLRWKCLISTLVTSRHMGGGSWSSCSVLDHKSLPPMFESRRGHIWRLFHLWLRFVTFGGRSAHLAYHLYKSRHKTSII